MSKSSSSWQWIRLRSLIFIALLLPVVNLQPARAAASPQFQEFPAPVQAIQPVKILAGLGDDIWFSVAERSILERYSIKSGQMTTYQIAGSLEWPKVLINGGDATLWFVTEAGVIEHVFPNTGQILSYSTYPFRDVPYLLASGGDGSIWYVTPSSFGHITSENPLMEIKLPYDAQNEDITSLAAGSDGSLWYSLKNGYIGNVTSQGDIREYPVLGTDTSRSQPIDLQLGRDGNLWYLDPGTNTVGRITSQGHFKTYPVPPLYNGHDWNAMTIAQDGLLWFTDPMSNQLISMNLQGHFAAYTVPTSHSNLSDISSDVHGILWFSETGVNKIASFTPPTIPQYQKDNSSLFQEFVVPGIGIDPDFILPGPKGDLWFSASNTNDIGRITTDGKFLPAYHTSEKHQGYGAIGSMARGKDGNMWFVEYGTMISRMTPTGEFSAFPAPNPGGLYSLSATSDGNVWFLDGRAKVGKITPQGTITEFLFPHSSLAAFNPYGSVIYLTAGPDGNLWITEFYTNAIGRITQQGKLHEYHIPPGQPFPYRRYGSEPTFITSGPGGKLWFLETGYNRLGSITPQGNFQGIVVNEDLREATGMTFGTDGNLWLTATHKIIRITLQGNVTEYPFGPASTIAHITPGPDGNLWFTDSGTNKIGRIILPIGISKGDMHA